MNCIEKIQKGIVDYRIEKIQKGIVDYLNFFTKYPEAVTIDGEFFNRLRREVDEASAMNVGDVVTVMGMKIKVVNDLHTFPEKRKVDFVLEVEGIRNVN